MRYFLINQATGHFDHKYRITARIYGEAEAQKLESKSSAQVEEDEYDLKRSQFYQEIYLTVHGFLFPGIPEHYPLKKKMVMAKANSTFGTSWDILLIILSILACAMYVAGLHVVSYEAVNNMAIIEIIITQFFTVDFTFNWFTANSQVDFFANPMTWVDLLTILPVYITLAATDTKNLKFSIFRFLRILRLIRILRAFRLLKGLSGVKRQLITLILTVLSLIFLAAGIGFTHTIFPILF